MMPRHLTSTTAEALLDVDDLHIDFDIPGRRIHAVRGVSFTIGPGETLGIVGESGSGKSVTARAIMGLLPTATARIRANRLRYREHDLLSASASTMRSLRGAELAVIYQDPMRALNPIMRVGDQIAEAIRSHEHRTSRKEVDRRVVELLQSVRIPDAAKRRELYPHQLSGGMRQRVVIAMALAANPRVLIADEPTTALDVTVQAEILDLLTDLQTELGMSMILVTHDLGVAAWHTDRIMVMYAGRGVEHGKTVELFDDMRMPYTRSLFDSIPRVDMPPGTELKAIAGRPVDPTDDISGCAFQPRCPVAEEICVSTPPPRHIDDTHWWDCWRNENGELTQP